jgi:histidinol phosphatase-like enzyme
VAEAPFSDFEAYEALFRLIEAGWIEIMGRRAPEERCACRKPRPGLILDAVKELGLEPRGSWLAGDTAKDVEAAHAAGVRAAVVESGWGGAERPGAAANARANEDAPRAELEARDLLDLAERLT